MSIYGVPECGLAPPTGWTGGGGSVYLHHGPVMMCGPQISLLLRAGSSVCVHPTTTLSSFRSVFSLQGSLSTDLTPGTLGPSSLSFLLFKLLSSFDFKVMSQQQIRYSEISFILSFPVSFDYVNFILLIIMTFGTIFFL